MYYRFRSRTPYRGRSSIYRRPAYRTKYATASRVKKVARTLGRLKSVVETKISPHTYSGPVGTIDTISQPVFLATSLTALSGGSGYAQHVGIKVHWQNMDLVYTIKSGYDPTNVPVAFMTRVLLIWHDSWNQQTVPNSIGWYLHLNGLSQPSVNILAHYNEANKDTFKVLHDKLYYQCDKQGSSSNVGGRFNISLKGYCTGYTENSAASNTNIQGGAMFMFVLTDCPPTFGYTFPYVNAFARLYYTDA